MTVKTALIACAIAACTLTQGALAGTDGFKDAASLQALNGVWRSTNGEDWGRGTFGTREFTFKDGQWSLRFELALDPGMTQKVFGFSTKGTYEVQKASSAVPGAFETLFREDQKTVTLLTKDPKLAAAFGLAACALVPGTPTDISATGCAIWKPVSVCGEDHDLLAQDEAGGLYFGVRPDDNDMCTPDKRPTRLLPAVARQ